MGVPVVEAPCEAEAQCAELAKSGKVYATATEDMVRVLTYQLKSTITTIFMSLIMYVFRMLSPSAQPNFFVK